MQYNIIQIKNALSYSLEILNPKVDIPLFATNANPLQL